MKNMGCTSSIIAKIDKDDSLNEDCDKIVIVNSNSEEIIHSMKTWERRDIKKLCTENDICDNIKFVRQTCEFNVINEMDFPVRINMILKDVDKFFEYELLAMHGKTRYIFPMYCTLIITYTQGIQRIYEPFYKYIEENSTMNNSSTVVLKKRSSDVFKMQRFFSNGQNRRSGVFNSRECNGSDGIEIIKYISNPME